MLKATVTVDPAFRVAPVNRRTFGSFVEHLGRCVYTGVFEPDHPMADGDGFRKDVLDLTREMGVSVVRYPGGNFVSGYRWEDSVGPVVERPRRLDHAWRCTETNEFGLNEFVRWVRKADVEAMMTINVGTRGVQEALDLLEYANHPSGTHLSDLRREHGMPDPHGIGLWCLGNEVDGSFQVGHKTAREYGRLAAEIARAMRMIDPDLGLVACGSTAFDMPSFGTWDAEVLDEAFDLVDYVSSHAYYEEIDGDTASFLASAVHMDDYIGSVVSAVDYVAAQKKSRKRIGISFDEWGVWYARQYVDGADCDPWDQRRWHEPENVDEWPVAPRLFEDVHNVADAVVVGNLLISLLRNSDRVAVACQSELVNVIAAPIRSEPGGSAWRQSIFYPFAITSRLATGDVLQAQITAPLMETTRYGEVSVVDAVATYDDDAGDISVFLVNRSIDDDVIVELDARAISPRSVVEAVGIYDDDLYAANTENDPDRVTPQPNTSACLEGGRLSVILPKASWTALRVSTQS